MQYSPKLKKAADEIKAVLKKYDIAGLVVIHTPGFSEYLYKVDPTYSGARIKDEKIEFLFASDHYKGDKEEQQKVMTDTVNMIQHFVDIGGMLALNSITALELLEKHIEVESRGGNHTSHNQQNN